MIHGQLYRLKCQVTGCMAVSGLCLIVARSAASDAAVTWTLGVLIETLRDEILQQQAGSLQYRDIFYRIASGLSFDGMKFNSGSLSMPVVNMFMFCWTSLFTDINVSPINKCLNQWTCSDHYFNLMPHILYKGWIDFLATLLNLTRWKALNPKHANWLFVIKVGST